MGETPGWNMISPILRNLKRESVTVDAKIAKKAEHCPLCGSLYVNPIDVEFSLSIF